MIGNYISVTFERACESHLIRFPIVCDTCTQPEWFNSLDLIGVSQSRRVKHRRSILYSEGLLQTSGSSK